MLDLWCRHMSIVNISTQKVIAWQRYRNKAKSGHPSRMEAPSLSPTINTKSKTWWDQAPASRVWWPTPRWSSRTHSISNLEKTKVTNLSQWTYRCWSQVNKWKRKDLCRKSRRQKLKFVHSVKQVNRYWLAAGPRSASAFPGLSVISKTKSSRARKRSWNLLLLSSKTYRKTDRSGR